MFSLNGFGKRVKQPKIEAEGTSKSEATASTYPTLHIGATWQEKDSMPPAPEPISSEHQLMSLKDASKPEKKTSGMSWKPMVALHIPRLYL